MFIKDLQNKARRPQPEVLYRVFRGKCKCVVSAVNPIGFTIFTLEKGVNQCFLAFYKMIQACFFPACPEYLTVLATKKEKIID